MVDFGALARAMLDAGVPYGLPVSTYGGAPSQGVHIGVFAEPFLSLIIDGRKTVESRFSRMRCAPFQEVATGDVLLLKQIGGPVCAVARIAEVWFHDLTSNLIHEIRRDFGGQIGGDDAFWADQQDAEFATLMRLAGVHRVRPVPVVKRDRRGWVSLSSRQLQMELA
jgi:hypothetical protein